MVLLYLVLALLLVGMIATILIYNGLVGARNRVDEAWSGINVQLKRRHDLVPNLVAAVKGYAAHEQETFARVVAARQVAVEADGPAAQARAENALTSAMVPIRALAEQYPELRATENVQRLQAELAQLEDEISASRRLYNGNVQRYTTKTQVFPSNLVATRGPFPPKQLFELDSPAERAVPAVSF